MALALPVAEQAPPGAALWKVLRMAAVVARAARLRGDGGPRAAAARHQEVARASCAAHGVFVEVQGPVPRGPALVVANHLGYLDPIVIAAIVPCVAVAKADVEGWPLVGDALRAMGCIFVRRGDASSGARVLRAALRAWRAGAAVLNFPEGTTSADALLPFKRGAFGAARIAGVPIVCARLAFDDPRVPWIGDASFLPHYLSLAQAPRIMARLRFAEPIVPAWSDSPRDLAARAEAQLRAMRR